MLYWHEFSSIEASGQAPTASSECSIGTTMQVSLCLNRILYNGSTIHVSGILLLRAPVSKRAKDLIYRLDDTPIH